MAKTTNPLFSMAATGTIAGCLAFRATAGRTVAQVTPRTIPRPSEDQTTNRDAWRDAAAAWRTVTQAEADEWAALAAQRSKPVFAVFAGEYRLQQIAAPALPLIPAE